MWDSRTHFLQLGNVGKSHIPLSNQSRLLNPPNINLCEKENHFILNHGNSLKERV